MVGFVSAEIQFDAIYRNPNANPNLEPYLATSLVLFENAAELEI